MEAGILQGMLLLPKEISLHVELFDQNSRITPFWFDTGVDINRMIIRVEFNMSLRIVSGKAVVVRIRGTDSISQAVSFDDRGRGKTAVFQVCDGKLIVRRIQYFNRKVMGFDGLSLIGEPNQLVCSGCIITFHDKGSPKTGVVMIQHPGGRTVPIAVFRRFYRMDLNPFGAQYFFDQIIRC